MLKKMLLLAVVTALAAPAIASAGRRSGVVVKVQPGGLVAVANAGGAVTLAHTPAKLRVGQAITFDARKLLNGTVAATNVGVVGKQTSLHVRGVVLAVQKKRGTIAISARGAVLVLRLKSVRKLASATAGAPPIGSVTDVTVSVGANGTLDAVETKEVEAAAGAGEFEGRVTALGNGSITLSDSGVSVTLSASSTIDLSKYQVGNEVLAYFTRDANGSLTLSAIGGDEDEGEADDANEIEGDVNQAEVDVEQDDGGGDDQAAESGD